MGVNYTRWPYYIPKFSIPRSSKIYQKWDFGFANIPSCNPSDTWLEVGEDSDKVVEVDHVLAFLHEVLPKNFVATFSGVNFSWKITFCKDFHGNFLKNFCGQQI
jgi:hypothetical protein